MEVAILLGTLLSLLVYLNKTAKPAVRTMGFVRSGSDRHLHAFDEDRSSAGLTCPQLEMVQVEGDVYFGSTAHLSAALNTIRDKPDSPKSLLVMARGMNYLDIAGADVWDRELRLRKGMGGDLYFHDPGNEATDIWRRTGFIDRLGKDHLFESKTQAIASIFVKLDPKICQSCRVRAFKECDLAPGPETPLETV
jgi:SulP family sulfate permease